MKINPRRYSLAGRASLPLVAAFVLATSMQTHAQTYGLSNVWALAGVTNNLDASANNRGMTYAASSNGVPANLVIVNNKGTHAIYAYDGAGGSL